MSNQLEKEFETTVSEVKKLIKDSRDKIEVELSAARTHLNNAVEISNLSGIPFESDISFINNKYVPKSMTKAVFKDLDLEVINELTDLYLEEYDFNYGGWEHSAIC